MPMQLDDLLTYQGNQYHLSSLSIRELFDIFTQISSRPVRPEDEEDRSELVDKVRIFLLKKIKTQISHEQPGLNVNVLPEEWLLKQVQYY